METIEFASIRYNKVTKGEARKLLRQNKKVQQLIGWVGSKPKFMPVGLLIDGSLSDDKGVGGLYAEEFKFKLDR